ncbi:LAMI_0H05336g1_1 [Lachancea mirantina]|uniref:Methylthioribose-1-phosphate isomerase n=1 Tax=Lachancea mirantina TaxID=1230905 RepID=A0A1G4KF12_9SACH|nr:LAMI_0H05336g1_1 [Lachancea mirantina]
MSLEAIQFDRSNWREVSVKVLDQLLLPYVTSYVPVNTIGDGYGVIQKMQVRGAPAIAIVGALSVLMEVQLLRNDVFLKTQTFYDSVGLETLRLNLYARLEFLRGSRPTAVNLSNALAHIRVIVKDASSMDGLHRALFEFVCALVDEDLANNKKMGDNGARYLLQELAVEGFTGDFGVLTICNTGSLATSGYGTALGVIRSLWNDATAKMAQRSRGGVKRAKNNDNGGAAAAKLAQVFPLETRPYNQGSRLTAYELVHDQIPATLIPDSSIAYRIATSEIPIKAAFVGADRIVRNGDTANKIGTYQLALLCRHFGIRFYVVAPRTTVDTVARTGAEIVVEERKPEEFQQVAGTLIDTLTGTPVLQDSGKPVSARVGVAPPQVSVWNPAFDVTPHEYIDGIITEAGVFTKDAEGKFDLASLF